MIYTRFGSAVKLVSPIDEKGWVECLRTVDKTKHLWNIADLKADDGINEINRESDKLKIEISKWEKKGKPFNPK